MTTATQKTTSELRACAARVEEFINHCYPKPSQAELDRIAKLFRERKEILDELKARSGLR